MSGEDENISDEDISKGSMKIVLLLLMLLISGFAGAYIKSLGCISPEKAPDAIVARFEKSIMMITEVRPGLISKHSSVGDLQEFYFRYGMLSRYILKSELDLMCYGKWNKSVVPISVESINDSINKACDELCNPDYVINETFYELGWGARTKSNEEIREAFKIG